MALWWPVPLALHPGPLARQRDGSEHRELLQQRPGCPGPPAQLVYRAEREAKGGLACHALNGQTHERMVSIPA